MTEYVVFDGKYQVHPGGMTKIDVSELNQVGLGVTGIIGLIGEAEEGQPNTSTTEFIHIMDSSTLAKTTFGSGPLADAAKAVFTPSADDRIRGGAARVKAVKVNQSTQSDVTLMGQTAVGTGAANQVTLTSVGFGTPMNDISLYPEVDANDTAKYQCTIKKDDIKEVITDIGGQPLMNLSFKGPEEPILIYTGTPANTSIVTQIDDGSIPVGAAAAWPNKWIYVPFLTTAAAKTNAAEGEWRRIASAVDGVSVTVNSALSEAPDDTLTYEVMSMVIFQGEIDTVATPTATNPDITIGKAIPVNGAVVAGIEITDVAGSPGLTEWANKLIRIDSGDSQGAVRRIKAATLSGGAGTSIVLELDDDYNFPSTNMLADDQCSIIDVDASASISTLTGTAGAAVQLATTMTYYNTVALGSVDVANEQDLTITLAATKTVYQVAQEINATLAVATQPTAGSNWLATVGYGRPPATLSTLFDFDGDTAGEGNYQIDICCDRDLFGSTKTRCLDNLNAFVNAINNFSYLISAARVATTGATIGAGMCRLYTELAPAWLTGAVRGAATNSDWQRAFDVLIKERCNIVVPLISRNQSEEIYTSTGTLNSVMAMAVDHVFLARGIQKSERQCYMGVYKTGTGAKTAVLNAASSLNDFSIGMCYQSPTILNVDSTLTEMQPWAMACLAAGMQAGSPIGTALTFKYVKVNDINNNSNVCDPADRTTSNAFLLGGVLFAEFIRGKGWRWVRHRSTWTKTSNLARTDMNLEDIISYIAYDLRTLLEERYTGEKADTSVIGRIRGDIVAQMQLYKDERLITESEDPVTGDFREAWSIDTCTISGDVLNLSVGIIPVPSINYELITMNVGLAVVSA